MIDEPGVGPIQVVATNTVSEFADSTAAGLHVSDPQLLSQLLASEVADRVRALVFDRELDPRCAALPSLEVVHADTIDADAFVQLGASEAPLRAIRAKTRGTVGVDGFAAVADAPAFANLNVVHLVDPGCRAATRAWFRGPRPVALRSLALINRTVEGCVDGFTEGGGYDLGAAPLVHLQQLDLTNQHLGMSIMSGAPRGLPELRRLCLAGTSTTGFLRFLRNDQLPRLQALDLHRVFLAPDELPHLARQFGRGLEELRVFAIGDEGAEQLATMNLPRLRSLGLDCCELTRIDWLEGAGWAPTTLDLRWNHLDDEAIASLRNPVLQRLVLDGNPVTANGVLKMLAGLPALTHLQVGLQSEARDALRRHHPALEVFGERRLR